MCAACLLTSRKPLAPSTMLYCLRSCLTLTSHTTLHCGYITSSVDARTQAVLLGGVISDWKSIRPPTTSIVQGSGIGLILFIIYSMDLKPLSDYNKILKYADDTSLLVPQHSSVSLEAEFTHISNWSESNKLKINTAKTK